MQDILQHIFHKDTLQEVPLEELQKLVEQYPYFAPAQLLLTRKYQLSGEEAFSPQLQKTAVYFHNPLWLEHLLAAGPGKAHQLQTEEPQTGSNHVISPMQEEAATQEWEGPALGEQPLLRNMLQGPAEETTLELQAYHTIDYFASQGIRLRADEHGADKLDKQMKSFTEWLKTMRRLPQSARMQLENINEEAIYRQASGSLEEKEIITETMAEVLIKQQNREKAVQIYYKLGLQYPAKKAYFAAKIEALKQ